MVSIVDALAMVLPGTRGRERWMNDHVEILSGRYNKPFILTADIELRIHWSYKPPPFFCQISLSTTHMPGR